jgi:acetyl-CoA acetyltransferase
LGSRAAIVGIGQTSFAKHLEASEEQLALTAILAALEDAGIAPEEVDALSSLTMEATEEVAVAKNLGLGDITFFSKIGYGGGGGCGTIGHLSLAISGGLSTVGVAWRSRKRGSGIRPWAAGPGALRIPGAEQVTAATWARPFGLLRPVDEIALLTRRYMHETGATRAHLAEVAMSIRANANRNAAAMMHDRPMSLDDYMNSRWISEPLCLFDNCLETDGALAVVVTSLERARDCPKVPVVIDSFAQALPRQHHHMVNFWAEDPIGAPARVCAAALWRQSELTPEDIDVVQIYDAFSPLVLISLEGYGFCGRGEAPGFVEDGNIRYGGSLPVNTSGGSLSEAYVHGMNLITEGVRQLRGNSTSQVSAAENCLVTSGEGVPTSALVLRREGS